MLAVSVSLWTVVGVLLAIALIIWIVLALSTRRRRP